MSGGFLDKRWFSHHALMGVDTVLRGDQTGTERHEARLVEHLAVHLLTAQRADPDLAHREVLDFYAFCQPRLARSTAQILQDLWVLHMLGEKRGGYFVEFGACDGLSLSNTLLLERDYGWQGILAEPNPLWHETLRRERTAEISTLCVAAHSGGTVGFLSTEDMPELSRRIDIVPDDVHERKGNRANAQTFEVETVSLFDLLQSYGAPSVIDYLSVDTEGSEYEILRDFDFSKYRFTLITVEHAGEVEKRENIRTLLEQQGYSRWNTALSRWDDWYVGPEVSPHGAARSGDHP